VVLVSTYNCNKHWLITILSTILVLEKFAKNTDSSIFISVEGGLVFQPEGINLNCLHF
jgi:hypothetical protein